MPTTINTSAPTSTNPVRRPLAAVDESREIERVVTRLQDHYPMLSSAAIRAAVDGSVHAFDGAQVRKFVPLLVERLARQSLEQVQEVERRVRAG
jgi:hypothetical protein